MLTDTKIAALKPPQSGQEEHSDHKVTGLRLRVGSGGAKTWTLRRRVGGKVINRKLGTYPAMKLAVARQSAERMIEALERDGSTQGIDRTFRDAVSGWMKANDKFKRRDIERQIELHIPAEWQDRKLLDIRKADVRELIARLEGEVLPNRVLATVKAVFNWAASEDWIEASPALAIKKPRAETKRDRVLTMDEIARVWRSAGLLGYPVGPWVQTLLLTAQRRSEVASMRWDDIDLDTGTWTLSGDDTKAGRAHLVPLAPLVVDLIEQMPRISDYVFSTNANTPLKGFAKAKASIDRWLESRDMGLSDPWVFHDLRRSAATHMVRLGIPELVVSRVLNHAVQGVTGQVYALHSYADEKRHALNVWAAEVDRAVNGELGGNVVAISG